MKSLIDNFRADPGEGTMRELVRYVRTSAPTDEELAHLSLVLAKSGTTLSIRTTHPLVDLASTGGPTSLSTLLGPLYLRALDCCIPKLGVAGRPAGGIDVMAQVPGYRISLTSDEVVSCIERCGYAHFVANAEHAPLDARLFDYRRRSGAQNIPALAIASLLSKKIAVGLQRAGLDIRVASHGNFGSTWSEARENGRRFIQVAKLVGIEAVCFLTDARVPYQPYVGRGESLIALQEVFDGPQNRLLEQHNAHCLAMGVATAGIPATNPDVLMAKAKSSFFENLEAQGGSPDAFLEYVDTVRKGHQFHFVAPDHGFVSIRLDRLRDVVTRFQGRGVSGDVFPDDMGVILCRMPGDIARPGDILATVRVHKDQWSMVEQNLRDAFELTKTLDVAVGFERLVDE